MSGEGRLVIVGTPIGNLSDLSPRGEQALAEADAIACEDTRRTGLLIQRLGLPKRPMIIVNEHTEINGTTKVLDLLSQGRTVALTTDAGMPAISDPGQLLIRRVAAAGYDLDVVPGPTAMSTAVVLSGLPSRRFCFEGFLPRKGMERSEVLEEIAARRFTSVLYESPKRVQKTLHDLSLVLEPEREVVVARELTKLYQEVVRGTISELVALDSWSQPKGEFVVVVGPCQRLEAEPADDDIVQALQRELETGASVRDAVATVVAATKLPKRRVYDLAINL